MSIPNSPEDTSPGGLNVKEIASQAGEKLMDTAEQQKRAGADFMTGVADAVRRAASEFEEPAPQAAHYIRAAADQMNAVSDALRRRDIGQMLSDVQSFARRQPSAFLGASFLAGFAVTRFLRSSAPAASSGNGKSWADDMPEGYGAQPPGANTLRDMPPPVRGS